MTYVIEKDLPIPAATQREAFPVKEMQIGDSVLTRFDRRSSGIMAAVSAAAKAGAPFSGYRFKSAMDGALVRVWRVS